MKFYYVYKTVQHPGINNFVAPYTLDERLLHVAEIKRRTGTEIPIICDSMENSIKHAMGSAPNGEFVIDPDGKIVRKRFWSNPVTLRSDLEELIGPVENLTKVEDLDVRFRVEPRKVASGVVPRPDLPQLVPVQLEPVETSDGEPYFVKLRAEIEPSLIRGEEGKLYLGFYLDPIYHVHWNNRAGNIEVELSASDGITLASQTLQGPEVQEDADVDPREFLVDVTALDKSVPINVTVKYVACDDDETFCLPITQQYRITLERDRDGGSRPGVFMPEMFAKVVEFDANGDGLITSDELPKGEVTLYMGHIDFNLDNVLDADEVAEFLKMFNNGRGFQKSKNDGDE